MSARQADDRTKFEQSSTFARQSDDVAETERKKLPNNRQSDQFNKIHPI
jgi:hypothetical protein